MKLRLCVFYAIKQNIVESKTFHSSKKSKIHLWFQCECESKTFLCESESFACICKSFILLLSWSLWAWPTLKDIRHIMTKKPFASDIMLSVGSSNVMVASWKNVQCHFTNSQLAGKDIRPYFKIKQAPMREELTLPFNYFLANIKGPLS